MAKEKKDISENAAAEVDTAAQEKATAEAAAPYEEEAAEEEGAAEEEAPEEKAPGLAADGSFLFRGRRYRFSEDCPKVIRFDGQALSQEAIAQDEDVLVRLIGGGSALIMTND